LRKYHHLEKFGKKRAAQNLKAKEWGEMNLRALMGVF
jgi:hypothetical protein